MSTSEFYLRIFGWLGIDNLYKMCYIFCVKCCDEDTLSGKIPRERAISVQGLCTPAAEDTTSELPVGNGRTGAPVIASMSDGHWP